MLRQHRSPVAPFVTLNLKLRWNVRKQRAPVLPSELSHQSRLCRRLMLRLFHSGHPPRAQQLRNVPHMSSAGWLVSATSLVTANRLSDSQSARLKRAKSCRNLQQVCGSVCSISGIGVRKTHTAGSVAPSRRRRITSEWGSRGGYGVRCRVAPRFWRRQTAILVVCSAGGFRRRAGRRRRTIIGMGSLRDFCRAA